MKPILLGAAAALTLATAAFAAGAVDGDSPRRGARADANADGKVTLAETQAAMKARFARMDSDRDGRLTKADMEALRSRRAEQRAERRGEVFARLDADRNGQLSQAEFAAAGEKMGRGRRGAMRRGADGQGGGFLGRLDADKDGAVTAAEMDQLAAKRFARLDANKDGAVTPDERPARRGRR